VQVGLKDFIADGVEYLIHSAPSAMNFQGDEVHWAEATARMRSFDQMGRPEDPR